MLRSHLHELLSQNRVEYPPFVVELSERMADLVGIYAFDICKASITCAKHEGRNRHNNEEFSVTLGCTRFRFENHDMVFRRERFGQPCSVHGEPKQCESVLLYGPSVQVIERLLCTVRNRNKLQDGDTKFLIFTWSAKHGEWSEDSFSEKRTMDSVVLDKQVHEDLIADVDEFTNEATASWYRKHHIPYRRGYMFHGPPGTGKTSTIVALTSYLKRNLYRVNLVAPGLCDDSLLNAMQQVPRESIIMFEDIDALFGVHREKNEIFSITFSGLLNSIDGICDSTRGIIFMFTTNHIEKVDDALKRCGRIDRSFHLGYCNAQQLMDLFLRFYPSNEDDARLFAKNCFATGNHITPAQVQHHFIMHRSSDSTRAAREIKVATCEMEHSTVMYT